MPVPTTFDDISETPTENSPLGNESVGPNANDYLQAAFAFIKQIFDGALKPLAALDLNGQKLTNIADGTISATSTDAVTGRQLQAIYRVGEQRMWHGAIANIAATWGPGWQLADGSNGTLDMRNVFPVGAGDKYEPGDRGGADTVTLTAAQMPVHAHGVSDPTHAHSVADSGHAHGVSDPGHVHVVPGAFGVRGGSFSQEGTNSRLFNELDNPSTDLRGTGIGIAAALSNIGIFGAATGIAIQNAGSGTAHENRPPYVGVIWIEYTGIGTP